MATRANRRAVLILRVAVLGLAAGCGKPTEEARQNRRLLDALLTAVTTKNRKELDKDAALWDKRQADKLPADGPHAAGRACIDKAKAGDWAGAEAGLYQFREADPFPR